MWFPVLMADRHIGLTSRRGKIVLKCRLILVVSDNIVQAGPTGDSRSQFVDSVEY